MTALDFKFSNRMRVQRLMNNFWIAPKSFFPLLCLVQVLKKLVFLCSYFAHRMAAAVPRPERSGSGSSQDNIIDMVKRLHKASFKCITAGLNEDEKGNLQPAKKYYEQGLKHLQQALQIQVPEGDDAEIKKTKDLQQKMKTNRDMVTDRLKEVQDKIQTLSIQTKIHTSASSSHPVSPRSSRRNPVSITQQHGAAHHASQPSRSQQPHIPRLLSQLPSGRKSKTSGGKHKANVKPTVPPPNNADGKESKATPLKGVDSKLANQILNEIAQDCGNTKFEDIIGLELAKKALEEIVILPSLRPELFTGLRTPAKGLLLFGPPGNGKTLLAKAVANRASSKFFNISASSLTSKWVGESEKLVRALFACARELQPSIIFIDEVDSLLTKRSEGEQESTRRLKTELLVCFDGVGSSENDRLLVMGATNLPQELDEAGLRRFPKRIYIPMPNETARADMVSHLLKEVPHGMSSYDIQKVVRLTEGFSGSDLTALVRDAAMGPIRELGNQLETINEQDIRPVLLKDFKDATRNIRPSTSSESLKAYETWAAEHGSS
eukprot:m.82056 g.82056  ORF g.82056 m.82056 type:complete len:549 (-) comp12851_c0_seq2:2266-3912(-)